MVKYKFSVLLAFMLWVSFGIAQKSELTKSREAKYYLIEAKEAITHGDIEKAIAIYNQCLNADSTCATAHYELANIAVAVKDTESALEHSRKAVALDPTNVWYQVQLAEITEMRGMLAHTAEVYKDLINLTPEKKEYYFKRIMLYETAEDWQNALVAYDEYQQKFGFDFNLLARKQAIYSKAGKEKESLKELRALAKSETNNTQILSLLAMKYDNEGNTKKAEKTYKDISRKDNRDGVTEMVLARYFLTRADYPNAFLSIKKSIESGEVNESMNVEAALALIQADTTAQRDTYSNILGDILIENYPENAIGYLLKAEKYRNAEDFSSAEEMLLKALEISPTSYNALAQLAITLNRQKKYDELYNLAQKGIIAFPQDHFFYLFKGIAASEKKEYEIADAALTTSSIYAKDPEIQSNIRSMMADNYYKSGKIQKAFNLFEEELRNDPENIGVLNNYSYFLSLENTDLKKAEKMSRKTIEKEPENPTYLDTYAWILYQMGDYPNALKHMEKALKLIDAKDTNGEIWEHYADILYKLGRVEEAKKEWQKALALPEAHTKRIKEKLAKQGIKIE